MRDPATDLVVEELIEFTIQYLCERESLELNDALNASFAINDSLLSQPKSWEWRPPARKRGRPPQRRNRHLQIAGAVAMLVEDDGLYPTRSHGSQRQKGPSACSIVTAALDRLGGYLEYLGQHQGESLSERTVEDIWNQYRLSPLIIHQGATNFARAQRYRISSRIIR